MTLAQIRLLKLLSDNGGNLSDAAETLHIAQSALSRRLQQLEAELKQKLFHRKGKRLDGLTSFGRQILDEAAVMLSAETNIANLAADHHADDRGTLCIATTHAQARYFLPSPLRKFRQKFPHVNLRFQQGQPGNLLQMLHHGQADFVICTEQLHLDEAVRVEPLYPWNHILALPPEHPLLEGEVNLERLCGYPLLTYIEGITGRAALAETFQRQGLMLNPIFSAADSDVLIEYIKSDFGVGILCGMAREEITRRGLAAVSMRGLLPQFETKTGWLKQRKLRRFEKILLKELIAYAQELNWRDRV